MIKKILKIILSILFFLTKKIFVRKNRVPHKIMDNLSNKLHSIFIFTSFPSLYILWFDINIASFYLNNLIYTVLFLQFVLIIRYYNPLMLEKKVFQSKIMNKINRLSLIIFILNWIFLSFLFSVAFLLISFINYGFYIFIINQINKQKAQEEFKKQFGDGDYSKEDIIKKHIQNLFESDLDINQIQRSEIKKQYRLMAKKYHPDVYTGTQKDKFTSINSSYKFLINLVK